MNVLYSQGYRGKRGRKGTKGEKGEQVKIIVYFPKISDSRNVPSCKFSQT